MIRPHVEFTEMDLISDVKGKESSDGWVNSVAIVVHTKLDEIQVSRVELNISLHSFLSRRDIEGLLQDQLISRGWLAPTISESATKLGFSHSELLQDLHVSHRWLSRYLALAVESADEIDFGRKGFIFIITIKVTPSPLLSMFQLGKISEQDLLSSTMTREPCSICLDSLVSGGSNLKHGVPTRMTCSHVFHDQCLLEWLQRKKTCPLCRTVLYGD